MRWWRRRPHLRNRSWADLKGSWRRSDVLVPCIPHSSSAETRQDIRQEAEATGREIGLMAAQPKQGGGVRGSFHPEQERGVSKA